MSIHKEQDKAPTMIRTRRAHRKSRLGCFECKRRKAKCDERKPQCSRCESTLHKCIYPPPPALKTSQKQPSPNFGRCHIFPLQPNPISLLEEATSFETSNRSTLAAVECCPYTIDDALALSDADLFHHYVVHTSRTLSHYEKDQKALQMSIPTLASRSKTVFHSLLAVSAVCLCCDMISKDIPPSPDVVCQVLMTGYQLYNLASEQMRELMSQPDDLKKELLLASALLLVPFNTASQQVNHWISSKSLVLDSEKPLSTTPRDVIVMMRGIRTTLQAMGGRNSSTPEVTDFRSSSSPLLADFNIAGNVPLGRAHVMFPIVSATSHRAFSSVQQRLNSLSQRNACYGGTQVSNDQLSACRAALDILFTIRADTFCSSKLSESSCSNDFQPAAFSLGQVGSWLTSYARRQEILLPTEPLTMRLLGFLVQTPQAYLDLVLPLLDQRLESPVFGETAVELTGEQALALDIYAHWSVFMFLVEEESWWIGNLPFVTLTGMVNRYGDQFVSGLWTEGVNGEEQWWPGSMLTILREIKRSR